MPRYDYLKMDWADVDGNGSDDLMLMWDGRHDLVLEIAYTLSSEDGTVLFDRTRSFVVPDFMYGRSIRNADTADYDGDGRADFVVMGEVDDRPVRVVYPSLLARVAVPPARR